MTYTICPSHQTITYYLSNTTDALTTFGPPSQTQSYSSGKALEVNPFAATGPSNEFVNNSLSIGPLTVNSGAVSGTLTFNTTGFSSQLNSTTGSSFFHNIPDGTYVMSWTPYFEKAGGQRIYFAHTVTAVVTNTTSGGLPYRNVSYTNSVATYTFTFNDNEDYEETCGDVASAISGRQKTADDALLVGELYKVGSALMQCTQRDPSFTFFQSDADFEPVSPSKGAWMGGTFTSIRPGQYAYGLLVDLIKDAKQNPPFYSATNFPQIFRIAIAHFTTVRPCRVIEVGIRSVLGIRISGLCNFRDSLTLGEIDGKACQNKEGVNVQPGETLSVDIYNSGQMTSAEERYSFFRVRVRPEGSASWSTFPQCFGIRGVTQQPVYNAITFTMPSQGIWEFELEPLSGWEIRSGVASGDLELIDSGLQDTRTLSLGVSDTNNLATATISFKGYLQEISLSRTYPFVTSSQRPSRGPQVFALTSVQRGSSAEIGIGYADGNSYVDAWGKVAETFIYDEISSSVDSGPEHEIVYINEVSDNASTPTYDNLALLGLTLQSGTEWQQLGQVSVWVTSGLANTHLFPEVLKDVLINQRYGKGDLISTMLLDEDSFTTAAAWCQQRRLFFDGAIVGKTNLRQWAADVAAANLLTFGESGGKFFLRTAWPGTVSTPASVSIKGLFNAGNIKENSFAMEFFEQEDRRPIQVSVKYREDRSAAMANLNRNGVFPVEREVLVREASPYASDTDMIESIDVSEHVSSRTHAIDVGKFIARMRRIPDHAVKFTTTYEGLVSSLAPSDYIRVVLDITDYDELRNGVILADGSLVATQLFNDGGYNVLFWTGKEEAVTTGTLTVQDNGTKASFNGAAVTGIFTLINNKTDTRTYQIERITPEDEGCYSIEAVHMPTDSAGLPLVALGWDVGANWVIV